MSAALLLLALAPALPPSTVRGVNVTASLIPEQAWIRPGRSLVIGLRLQMAPEWHTYWKNPGDSGLPTRIRWTLPQGFEAGPIAWPTPERFATNPLASYGYDQDVMLLSEVRTPAQVGSPVVIAARVDWLECKDVCRPGKAELAVQLEVTGNDPLPDPRWAKAFADTRARLPRSRPPGSLAASAGAGGITLRGAAPAARDAYFFPARPDLVEHGAAQALTPEAGGFRLRIPMAANAKLPDSLEGVLVADGVGFEVAVPIRPRDSKGGAR